MTVIKKLIRLIKDIWIVLGLALVFLVAIEAFFSLAFYIKSFLHTPDIDFRIKADTYTDHSWAMQYYKEIDEIEHGRTMRWKSYVYWRRIPRRGKFINIDSNGLRKTNNVSVSDGAGSTIKVFIFGGSTVWGLGVGDDYTIPSIFAREIKNKGIDCEVVNFGQYAYVSTQEVIELMLQLQMGNIPDAVIFYDGVNDTFGAFQLGVPGLPFDEIRREKEFNLLERPELKTIAAQSTIRQLSIVRFLNGALRSLGLRRDDIRTIPLQHERQILDRETLTRVVVETYLNNIKLVQALSKSYGFTCLFYWQPVIYLKQHLTEYERRSLELDFNYPGMKEFYLNTYALLKQRSADLKKNTDIHDISSIFSATHEPIYVDFNHMGEKGNSLVARRMAEDFARLVRVDSKIAEQSDAHSRQTQ